MIDPRYLIGAGALLTGVAGYFVAAPMFRKRRIVAQISDTLRSAEARGGGVIRTTPEIRRMQLVLAPPRYRRR